MKTEGFAERLAALLSDRVDDPYAWGTNDCATWAADVVLAVTGIDHLEGLRGSWHDEASAMAVLEQQGGLVAFMDRKFPRRPSVQLAQRGDIALVRLEDGTPSLAAVEVAQVVAPSDDGLLYMDLGHALIAWEI